MALVKAVRKYCLEGEEPYNRQCNQSAFMGQYDTDRVLIHNEHVQKWTGRVISNDHRTPSYHKNN